MSEVIRHLRRIKRGAAPPGDYLVNYLQEQVAHNVEMGDFHLVERKARRMIAANPDRSEGHFALGVACLELERLDEALDAFLDAHARDPDHVPTLYDLGFTYLQLDDPEQALPWLEHAVRQEPEHLSALYHLGAAYERLGRRDEALTWWQRTLEIDPDHQPAQERLHEIGEGPEPAKPPLPPRFEQMRTLTPIVKDRMSHPQVHRNGGLTLTYDGGVGFVLEDAENPHNATIYADGPFQTGHFTDRDRNLVLDMIGVVKLMVNTINADNTREVAVLAYYTDRPVLNYRARFEQGRALELHGHGQFVVTEVPRFFKLRIDSTLSNPFGDPMQGMLIYMKQSRELDILISTLKTPSQ